MEEIIKKSAVPAMPEDIWIHYANQEFNTGEKTEIKDLSKAGVKDLVEIASDEEGTAWSCFDPEYLDSDEESPIECSDGQSEISMKTTMRDRELAARCVEWYIHTGEPYPGMDRLKLTW